MLGIGKLAVGAEDYYLAISAGIEDYYVGMASPGQWIASSQRLLGLSRRGRVRRLRRRTAVGESGSARHDRQTASTASALNREGDLQRWTKSVWSTKYSIPPFSNQLRH